MTTLRLDPHYHPIHWPASAMALLSGAILIILSATIYVPPRMDSLINAASQAGSTYSTRSPLPFTVQEVKSYFAREIGTVPAQFGETTLFPQPASLDDTEDYEVAVTAQGSSGLSVEFRGTGAGPINLARGFLGSSFFYPTETSELVSMLGHRDEAPSAHLPRFSVQMRVAELIDMSRLTIQFSPLAD